MKKNLRNTFILLLLTGSVALQGQSSPYSLDDCINYAWENSTNLERSANQIRIDQSTLEQSRSALLPNLNLSLNQNLSSYTDYNTTNADWDRASIASSNVSLSSSMTLYNGAKLKNTIQQNILELASSELDAETEKDLISLDILTAYINVLLAREQYDNSVAQLQSTEKLLEYAQVRQSTGIISKADYLNIKSQYSSEKATAVSTKNELRMDLVSLMQLMNMPVSNDFDIVTPEIEKLLAATIGTGAEEIYMLALGIRPEVKTAKTNIENAEMAVKIARADYLPSLSLSAGLSTDYSDNVSGIDFAEQYTNQVSPSLGLSLSVPLFQRKKVKTQVAQASIQADNYRLNLQDVKNDLRKSIEQACVDAENARIIYEAYREQCDAEQESYEMAEEMFSQGLINSVDYITSKNSLRTAENNLSQAKYNLVLQNKVINYYKGEDITL